MRNELRRRPNGSYIERVELSYVVKDRYGRIREVFDTATEAKHFLEPEMQADLVTQLDAFRSWKCLADSEEERRRAHK